MTAMGLNKEMDQFLIVNVWVSYQYGNNK